MLDVTFLHKYYGVKALLEVSKCFEEAQASKAAGSEHENNCFGPVLLHSVIVLTVEPVQHERAYLVKVGKIEAQQATYVTFELKSEHQLVFFESEVDRAAHDEVVALLLVLFQKLRHLRVRNRFVSFGVRLERLCVTNLCLIELTQSVDIVAHVELAQFAVELIVLFKLSSVFKRCYNGRGIAKLEVQAFKNFRFFRLSHMEELDVSLVTNPFVSLFNKGRQEVAAVCKVRDLLQVSDRLRALAVQAETYLGPDPVLPEDDKGDGALTKEVFTF